MGKILIVAILQCFLFCSVQSKAHPLSVTGPDQFYSYNYPKHGFGFRSGNDVDSYIVEAPSHFMIVAPGLTGAANTVSFESEGKFNNFLRHQGFLLKMMPNDQTELFKKDATFIPRRDLFYRGYTVYESVNFPGRYIRHQDYRLKLSQDDGTKLMHKDSSFFTVLDGDVHDERSESKPTLFQSYNFPKRNFGIQHTNQAWLVPNNPARFKLVSPGLAGIPNSVSFQSESDSNSYLRHSNWLMWLHPFVNTGLYKDDATFMPRPDLFHKGYTVYESVNFPGHYIRHQGFRLKLSKEDGTALLHMDSSFFTGSDGDAQVQSSESKPTLFQSYNFPKRNFGIQHTNQAWLVPNNPARFKLVSPGLAGIPNSVSFQSESDSNSYLRHSNWLMWLHPFVNTALYKDDATFMPRPDLFHKGYTVYESVNFPGRYIRHQGFRLKLSKEDGTKLLHMDSSFFTASDGDVRRSESKPALFQSFNYPAYNFGIKKTNQAFIVPDNPSRFKLVSPGLAGVPNSVSFQSESDPNSYLRHSGFDLWLHPFQNAKLYKDDATFMPRYDLFYEGYTVYESVNFPGRYIRHQGYRLKISVDDGSELLHKDASFRKFCTCG